MARAVLSEPHFHSEETAFAYVEARLWPKGPVCHHCGERERVGKLAGKSTRPPASTSATAAASPIRTVKGRRLQAHLCALIPT
jgi:Transposase zinc-ribbon domain